MKPFRRRLLATAASLTFVFGGAALAQEKAPAPGLHSIETLYQTKDSKALAGLEARINAERPKGMPRVIFIDPDVMATWLQIKGSAAAYGQMTTEYLASKGVTEDAGTTRALALGSMTMTPMTAVPASLNPKADLSKATGVVVPYNPNLSAEGFMREAFSLTNPQTGEKTDAAAGLKLTIGISRAQMEEIIDAREAWSCFEPQLTLAAAQTKDFDHVMARHRLEVFKDVGGLMQAVRDGADPSVISKFADFRESAAGVTASRRGGVYEPGTGGFYGSVIDDTGPALLDLKARIDVMGVEKFRQLSGDEMKQMADDITAKNSLKPEAATHIIGFNMLGDDYFRTLSLVRADPAAVRQAKEAVTALVNRQDAAVKRSLREMTAGEMEGAALVPEVNPLFSYQYLQRQIFSDKDVQKNPDDPAARLRVHQALVDKTRDLMDKHPGQEALIRQVLEDIFLSNPMMKQAPPLPADNLGAQTSIVKA